MNETKLQLLIILMFYLSVVIIVVLISFTFNTFAWDGTTPCDEPINDFRPFIFNCRSV